MITRYSKIMNTFQDKFSRQIGAIGINTMNKLTNLNIIVVGAAAIGQECIKCISLLGVRTIHIYDPTQLTKKNQKDIYYTNAELSNKKGSKSLAENAEMFSKELNTGINIKVITKFELDYITLNNIHAVIITKLADLSISKIEKHCMLNNVKFILGLNYELEGYIFSNFNNHTVTDRDGEPCESGYVESFRVDNSNVIITIETLGSNIISNKGRLLSGNETKDIDIKASSKTSITTPFSVEIESFLKSSPNIKFVEIKESLDIVHGPLHDVSQNNTYNYISDTTSFPSQESDDKYRTFMDRLLSTSPSSQDFKQKEPFFILSSIIGGILAHEVIKLTGKYIPIDQELYINYENLRGKSLYKSSINRNSGILDRDVIKALKKQNIFMVGCGALGCEISKNLGMMDMCSGTNAILTISDMDTIELSNLNRQFLFRNEDIGKHKSDVVKTRLHEYTPRMNIDSHTYEIGKTTENVFNSSFWNNNNLIINALDNVEARRYVDSKCVEFDKPLFESGTLGSKCNSQTIIPHKTATYSEIIDVEERSIPMCTIKSFPNKIEHCVEWGLETFNNCITQPLLDINTLVTSPDKLRCEINSLDNNYVIQKRLEILDKYIDIYNSGSFTSFANLVVYIYKSYFENPVRDILHSFPDDLTDSGGNAFWSGKKLKPTIIGLNEIPPELVVNLYNIISKCIKIDSWSDKIYDKIYNELSATLVTDYVCKKIQVNEDKDTIDIECDSSDIIERVFSKKLTPVHSETTWTEYDKDDAILLGGMYSIANMRAKIYGIEQVDTLEIKLISGKIIPALSTTTTVIAGFVIMEVIKHIYNRPPTDININLGTNQFILFDSLKPNTTYDKMFSNVYGMPIHTVPYKFTTWDKIKFNCTSECCPDIYDLVGLLNHKFKIEIDMLLFKKAILYNRDKSPNKSIFELYKDLDIRLCENIIINISSFSKDGTPILMPPLVLRN